jgi:hypothetical protein
VKPLQREYRACDDELGCVSGGSFCLKDAYQAQKDLQRSVRADGSSLRKNKPCVWFPSNALLAGRSVVRLNVP